MLKKYKCHKLVDAAKILEIQTVPQASALDPIGLQPLFKFEGGTMLISMGFIDHHKPQAGGYFVRYDDGYTSFSPAHAFETGYKEIVTPADKPTEITRFFAVDHLPWKIAPIADYCRDLALTMDAILPASAEKTAGLRKLLEAKDCFVRAGL